MWFPFVFYSFSSWCPGPHPARLVFVLFPTCFPPLKGADAWKSWYLGMYCTKHWHTCLPFISHLSPICPPLTHDARLVSYLSPICFSLVLHGIRWMMPWNAWCQICLVDNALDYWCQACFLIITHLFSSCLTGGSLDNALEPRMPNLFSICFPFVSCLFLDDALDCWFQACLLFISYLLPTCWCLGRQIYPPFHYLPLISYLCPPCLLLTDAWAA